MLCWKTLFNWSIRGEATQKMLNIIHRFYACVGFLPKPAQWIAWWWNAVPRTKSQRVPRVRREVLYPARDDFLSGFARLSHENVYTRHRRRRKTFSDVERRAGLIVHCFLISIFIAIHFDWRQKGPQSKRASCSPACALSGTFDIYHLFTGVKFILLYDKRHSTACARRPCVRRMKSGYHHIFAIDEVQRTQQERKKGIIDWFFAVLARVGGLCALTFRPLRHLAVAWVVDVFPPDFHRLYA